MYPNNYAILGMNSGVERQMILNAYEYLRHNACVPYFLQWYSEVSIFEPRPGGQKYCFP